MPRARRSGLAALLDELRSRADRIARRTGGHIRETVHPNGSSLRVELTVNPPVARRGEQRAESAAAGVRAGHYSAPAAWGEDLARLLGDTA
jgi:hypothetical protein